MCQHVPGSQLPIHHHHKRPCCTAPPFSSNARARDVHSRPLGPGKQSEKRAPTEKCSGEAATVSSRCDVTAAVAESQLATAIHSFAVHSSPAHFLPLTIRKTIRAASQPGMAVGVGHVWKVAGRSGSQFLPCGWHTSTSRRAQRGKKQTTGCSHLLYQLTTFRAVEEEGLTWGRPRNR